jgi:hypothetical protein
MIVDTSSESAVEPERVGMRACCGGESTTNKKPPTAQQFIDRGSVKREMRVTVKRGVT